MTRGAKLFFIIAAGILFHVFLFLAWLTMWSASQARDSSASAPRSSSGSARSGPSRTGGGARSGAPRGGGGAPSDGKSTGSAPLPLPTREPERPIPVRIDDIVEKMDWGNIAFNAPERMDLNSSSTIHLVLSPQSSIEELKKQVAAEGAKEGARIRISELMEAHLSGAGFQISPINPETQAISQSEITEWKWEVVPTRGGRNILYLTLTAVIEVGDKERPRRIRTFDKTIEVEVSGWQSAFIVFRENWEWMWTLIVLPVGAWIWRRQRKAATQEFDNTPTGESIKAETPPAPEVKNVAAVEEAHRGAGTTKQRNRKGKRRR